MAPNQEWFHFLLHLENGLSEKDTSDAVSLVSPESDKSSAEEAQSSHSDAKVIGENSSAKPQMPPQTEQDSAYGDGKKIPDAPMIQYRKLKKKYKREDPLTESEVRERISRIQYYVGSTGNKGYTDFGLANALVVNKRRGKVFERSSVFEFGNLLLRVPGVETRAACFVRLVHPIVGAMEVYSLHLDHMWEQNRQRQFDILMENVAKASQSKLPHVLMGDFNAITKSDYTPDYEDEMITTVRANGRWEAPTYTLTQHIAKLGYVDFWRKVNPTVMDHDVTTCAYHTRIDYLFLSPDLAELVDWTHTNTYAHILDGVFHSDHFPVIANMQFKSKSATKR